MKSFYLSLLLGLSVSVPSCASDVEAFPELTWAAVVKGSVACLEEEELPTTPTVEFTGLEHDLKIEKRPAFLHFKAGRYAYKLCDNDGGATLAFLYAACMYKIHQDMVGTTPNAAQKRWKQIRKDSVAAFPFLKQLFKHSLNRMVSARAGLSSDERSVFKSIQNELDTNDISYRTLFNFVGEWLRKNYSKLPPYIIEVTSVETKKSTIVRGIQPQERGRMGYTPIGNTLHHFCTAKLYEKPLAYVKGVWDLDLSNLDIIITAYDVERSLDQKLHSDYRIVRTTSVDEDGSIVIIEKLIPIASNPVAAVPKNETARERNKVISKKSK